MLKKINKIEKFTRRSAKRLLGNEGGETRGITLMETIFALAILVIGILSVLTMTTSSVVLSQASEQNLVVVNLAREGLELVRGVRDAALTNADVLPAGKNSFFAMDDGCYTIDASQNNFKLTSVIAGCNSVINCNDCRLYRDQATGMYVHNDAGAATLFRRAIQIQNEGGGVKILSKVAWSERGRNHEFTLEDYLTEWQ